MAERTRHVHRRNAPHSHLSEGRATVLLYCLTVVLMLFLVGSMLNGIGLFPPAITAATSAFGGALAAVLGVLGGLLAGSILQEGFKEIWQYAKRSLAIVMAALTIGLLIGSTCLVVYLTSDPYTHGLRYGYSRLVLDDPLRDNSSAANWQEGKACTFSNGALQVETNRKNYFHYCSARATNFRNFVYEVQMTIVTGDCGRILFRRDMVQPKAYSFSICNNGSYRLDHYETGTSSSLSGEGAILLYRGTSASAIHTGLNRSNLIAVVASSDTLELWSNRQLLARVPESATVKQGRIAVAAGEDTLPTKVTFRNVKVWTLP